MCMCAQVSSVLVPRPSFTPALRFIGGSTVVLHLTRSAPLSVKHRVPSVPSLFTCCSLRLGGLSSSSPRSAPLHVTKHRRLRVFRRESMRALATATFSFAILLRIIIGFHPHSGQDDYQGPNVVDSVTSPVKYGGDYEAQVNHQTASGPFVST